MSTKVKPSCLLLCDSLMGTFKKQNKKTQLEIIRLKIEIFFYSLSLIFESLN